MQTEILLPSRRLEQHKSTKRNRVSYRKISYIHNFFKNGNIPNTCNGVTCDPKITTLPVMRRIS